MITGVAADLPLDPARNTASVAVAAMADALGLDHGFTLAIDKGIPLASGLGGSAASAVAAVVAANALLDAPVEPIRLLAFAAAGEKVASGALHLDNLAASLFGGLVLVVGLEHAIVTRIPVPAGVRTVLAHPHLELSTRAAREVLSKTVRLSDATRQQANLAGFVMGCFASDLALIRASMKDVMIEPQRRHLIPGFDRVKAAAMAAGALGCSIAGAGPTMFAWAEAQDAEAVSRNMAGAFEAEGVAADAWVAPPDTTGAEVIERS
jgi:homoserine kinase